MKAATFTFADADVIIPFQSTPPVKAATVAVLAAVAASKIFQSTPPVKAATVADGIPATFEDISIHAAREGGDLPLRAAARAGPISIHAAREGGDHIVKKLESLMRISIHAAREGGDVMVERCPSLGTYFNPRRP